MSLMRTLGVRGFVALTVLLGLGCARTSSSASISAGIRALSTEGGRSDAGHATDAGPVPIPGARLTASVDGGVSVAALDGGPNDAGERVSAIDLSAPGGSIQDWAVLTFTADVPLDDFRARLLGSDGQLAANHAETWIADGGTQVRFFPAPLWPSRCCRFVVDGQTDKLPSGVGSRFMPFEVDFSVAADPNRPPPARAAKAAKRHRRHRR